MEHEEIVVRVRFASHLPFDELMEIVERRAPEFRALTGLRQKYYLHDVRTGEYAGLYFWESARPFEEFRDSELRATIAGAYQAVSEPEIEVYRVIKVLRDAEG